MVLPAAVGPTTYAGPKLGIMDLVRGSVIRFDAYDGIVFDEELKDASSTAIMCRAARAYDETIKTCFLGNDALLSELINTS